MTTSGRIAVVDGVRGVAVMGIVLMNVNAFAMPFAAYDNPANYGPLRLADGALWAIEAVLVDGKMRALFSALFGASLLLVTDRAAAAGLRPARVHYARMATLLAIGIAHACLLWDGDILVLYALVGLVAFPLRRLTIESQLVLAGLMMLLALGALGLNYQSLAALAAAVRGDHAGPADLALWHDVLDQIGRPRPATLAADLALHRGGWGALVAARATQEADGWLQDLVLNGPETLGLMLLGMAGLRSGFLAGGWPRARYRRIATVGLAIGVPPMAAIAAGLAWADFPPLATSLLTDVATMPLRWLLATAEAALLVLWLTGPDGALRRRVIAAGRVALSNYLGTSLVLGLIFYGYGLGLYGRVERWMLLPLVLACWLAMLGWSHWWLARFAQGPLEAVWRRIARPRFVSTVR